MEALTCSSMHFPILTNKEQNMFLVEYQKADA